MNGKFSSHRFARNDTFIEPDVMYNSCIVTRCKTLPDGTAHTCRHIDSVKNIFYSYRYSKQFAIPIWFFRGKPADLVKPFFFVKKSPGLDLAVFLFYIINKV